jgi:hypothetical protein
MDRSKWFKGRQFTDEVILWAVRWYLMFRVSYRDLELMLLDRGVEVDHTTIFRWIQAYAPEIEKRRPANAALITRSRKSWLKPVPCAGTIRNQASVDSGIPLRIGKQRTRSWAQGGRRGSAAR